MTSSFSFVRHAPCIGTAQLCHGFYSCNPHSIAIVSDSHKALSTSTLFTFTSARLVRNYLNSSTSKPLSFRCNLLAILQYALALLGMDNSASTQIYNQLEFFRKAASYIISIDAHLYYVNHLVTCFAKPLRNS